MEGQFHKELSLLRDNEGNVIGVAVSGPIGWDADEAGAKIFVTITQGDVEIGSTVDVKVPEIVWAAVALGPGLKEGRASAEAGARVHTGDGTDKTVRWTSPPDPPEITLR